MNNNKKIIDANPAPYPKTSTPEYMSVVTLINILDKNRTRFDLNILDKFPNTDGIFEIVTEDQVPIGKLDIQVKILEKKNLKIPKYQCQKDFLAFCQESILPVILIVVDTETEVAYWIHVSREVIEILSKKIKGDSVSLAIPKTNLISKADTKYIDNWIVILETYITRVINYDNIEKELLEIKVRKEQLEKITNPALGIEKPYFREIHFFLDYYNDLLSRDFQIIKNIFYSKYWKIGIAYSKYQDKELQYSLYPISYFNNDIQIKEFDQSKVNLQMDFLNSVGHFTENPIKNNPLEYAYKQIIKDLKKIVDGRALLPVNKFIALEYITAFIDKNHEFLGLDEKKETYSLKHIEYAITDFMPMICDMAYPNSKTEISIDEVYPVEIDFFRWHVMPKQMKKWVKEVKKKISNGERASREYKFYSKDFNLDYFYKLIMHLKHLGIDVVKRPYPIKRYPDKTNYFMWEVLNKEQVKEMVTTIFEELPDIYNKFIEEFFPNIYNKIEYFTHFNKLIINIETSGGKSEYNRGTGIEFIYLKNISNPVEKKIEIYMDNEKSPIIWQDIHKYWKKNLLIENDEYKLLNSSSSFLENIYYETPMLDFLYDTLKHQLEDYLKPYHKETSLFRFTRF